MLVLKRMRYFNEFIRDTIDGRIIGPGEYYYEDDIGDTIISAEHYWELKKQKMEEEWDDSYYNYMESQQAYKEKMKQVQQAYAEKNILKKVKLQDLR